MFLSLLAAVGAQADQDNLKAGQEFFNNTIGGPIQKLLVAAAFFVLIVGLGRAVWAAVQGSGGGKIFNNLFVGILVSAVLFSFNEVIANVITGFGKILVKIASELTNIVS